ncbi:chemotaxis protein [Yersinia alsatica]|uniref:Chemotaxis protein n=1 Tax=Yersinia alsatica TaxID=2890317 RepID=A0ABY5USQ3_9GAMM|nr:chemotaxis protein [Yersinia alsatica]OWF66969.1 chemotaxis protein [Yersinia frederiksenii]UWM45575.1 chemotaxis protein [Yersinia alsatica]CNL73203.1 methyl-accepting chemotaxis protein [Yersinia frederiksenii]CNL96432.1 methyl-accepting chemotaxis protein [Yersinia frederiksenii]
MNMTVNDKIVMSGQDAISPQGKVDVGNNAENIMSDLSDIIFQMTLLFKKMRDLLNTYNQKQQVLGWDIQVNSMNNKREAIDKTASGAITSGVCSILSGVVSGVGAVASIKVGDIASHGSAAFGLFSSGSSKWVEADMTRSADLLRMTSDLQSSGAQTYNKNISELLDKLSESRQNMKDLGNTINNMMGQISMAVKL